MKLFFLYFAIYFCFYIIGAYATTDILRLLKNSTTPVNAPDCYCPICHNKIKLQNQLPIFAYLKNHGKCAYCKSPIPFSDLFLEIFLFFTLSVSCTCLQFTWTAFFVCLAIYESTKLLFCLYYGVRQDSFFKNLLISTKNNCVLFLFIAILFLILQIS